VSAELLARELHGRRSNRGFVARCPAHDDHRPSLSIDDRNGQLLVKCHAGCSQKDIIAALRSRNLWPEATSRERIVVATYVYRDENGAPLFRVCRTEPKGFYQQRPSAGLWVNGLGKTRRVLYRLPEVIEAPIVFLVEGEKDVETLREWGFVATTVAGGAKARWLSEYTDTLRGREVILIPDNDGPGWQRAVELSHELAGKVGRLVVLNELPRDVKDISEWFQAGHSETELIAILEGVHAT